MTAGPYAPEPGDRPPLEGRVAGYRMWQTVQCIGGRHDACPDDGLRCDCSCHALTTGAWVHGLEPA